MIKSLLWILTGRRSHRTLPARWKSISATKDILTDRKNIEKQYKTVARGMAYPYGTYDERMIALLESCRICYSRTVKSTENFFFPKNWLELHPTCHHREPELMNLLDSFLSADPYPARTMMFYLWGHSYEFDDNNNWYIIENFAERAGGNDDVWYATNIEIYDYVQAFKSLIATVDESVVYNPTNMDVWVFINKEKVCIKAGETFRK